MIKVGLTGGIGSGKTTIANFFAELGVFVIDTDQIAHQLIEPGKPAYQKIIQHFSSAIINSDGCINRKTLKNIVFSNAKERQWLEQLLHPLITQEMQQSMQKAPGKYCIAVVPLLIEKKLMPLFDRILVVDLPIEIQRQRLQQREKNDPKLIEKILQTQCISSERLQFADDIIHNEGDLQTLQQRVNILHNYYLTL